MANYFRQLSAPENLLWAWKKLHKKKHSRGFDEQTIEEFKNDLIGVSARLVLNFARVLSSSPPC